MAHAVENTRSLSNPLSDMLNRVRDAFAKRRTYNKVLRELSGMSDRELTDINLCRGDIRRVAWEATQLYTVAVFDNYQMTVKIVKRWEIRD